MALTSEDVHEINNLLAKYNFAIDYGDAEGWADTFADGATFDPGMGDPVSGRDDLVAFARSTLEMLPQIKHNVWNIIVDGDGSSATTKLYLQVTNGYGGDAAVMISGRYDDQLTKTADGWRFTARKMIPDA